MTEVVAPIEEHNRFAGQGSVLLDIGGDVGALIVHAPAAMVGVEIEIRPAGTDPSSAHHDPHDHDTDHDHAHSHSHSHQHGDGHAHRHGPGDTDGHHHDHGHHPHVAVVARPTVNGPAHTAVFPELVEGDYELYRKLGGPVELTATVIGAQVVELTWPT